MSKKKVLYTYVEIDDNTPIQRLSVLDQIRVLMRKLTYDPASELKQQDALTKEEMTLKANLMSFIRVATAKIRKGQAKSVTCDISSDFSPVIDEVLSSPSITQFYKVELTKPEIDYDISFFYKLKLTVIET